MLIPAPPPTLPPSQPPPAFVTKAATPTLTAESRFSEDFRSWLNANGYGKHDFAKGALPGFGGRAQPGEKVTREPVIFIHGNADSAVSWNNSVEYFRSKGYPLSALYGMTWGTGTGDVEVAKKNTHSKKYVGEVRAFIEAVKAYTGAARVDVVTHSMGVTLTRKALQGGQGRDRHEGRYDVGSPLTGSVDTFVGIAGANRGLTSAYLYPNVPTSNAVDGFHPGVLTPLGVVKRSAFLEDLNRTEHDEGQHVFSIWSKGDRLINFGAPGGQGLVYGVPTAAIPGEDGSKVYDDKNHFEVQRDTAEVQYLMVVDHRTGSP